MTGESILIVGASARAAAQSAIRAGMRPFACDLFADADLRRLCPVQRIAEYPRGLLDAAARFPDMPWMYVGGLENHAPIVGRLAQHRPLLGNGGEILRRVRDPFAVHRALAQAGVLSPECRLLRDEPPQDGRWLLKRSNSAGGAGVALWDTAASRLVRQAMWSKYGYFQRRIVGTPVSAVFVAAEGRCVLLGATRQLVGRRWCGATAFHYCGSLGPLRHSAAATAQWTRIGDLLADEFGLTGIFGVDAIHHDEQVWPVEVNPRYVASAEVLERAGGFSAVRVHFEACALRRLPTVTAAIRPRCCAKAILFAPRWMRINAAQSRQLLRQGTRRRCAPADVPPAGTIVGRGKPLWTMLVESDSPAEVGRRLRRSMALHRCV